MTVNGKKVIMAQAPAPSWEAQAREHICLALDTDDLDQAVSWVKQMRAHVGCFKIGPALIMKYSLTWVVETIQAELGNSGCGIFVDMKFHDIPATVAASVRQAANLGVQMITVHAGDGKEILAAAVANRGACDIIAVTVLTSVSDEGCKAVHHRPRRNRVQQLAHLAEEAGCQGIVCAPTDLTSSLHCGLRRIVPGIRPSDMPVTGDDQANSLTPREAILRGAHLLVVGRPIIKSAHSQTSARSILFEIRDTLQAEADRKAAEAAARKAKAKAAGQPPPTKP